MATPCNSVVCNGLWVESCDHTVTWGAGQINCDLKSSDNSKSHVPGPVGPRHDHMAYSPRDTHEMMIMIMIMMMMDERDLSNLTKLSSLLIHQSVGDGGVEEKRMARTGSPHATQACGAEERECTARPPR